jgi:lycopene cyclase domain-containing protein
MTYFGFLALFLGVPLVWLGGVIWYDHYRNKKAHPTLRGWPVWQVILTLIIIAVVYTTLWDNYLVATGVWWYDPKLVTGIVLGWVPLEEYTFFVSQTLLTGLWLLFLAHRLHVAAKPGSKNRNHRLRWIAPLTIGLIWLGAAAILLLGWQPGTYLGLELVWALPPIILQLAFGADILWRHRWLVLLGIITPTVYLSLADAVAIRSGTWTIDPSQSLNVFLSGQLPLEELIFFLLTNALVTFGIVLALACESQERVPVRVKKWLNYNRLLVKSSQ